MNILIYCNIVDNSIKKISKFAHDIHTKVGDHLNVRVINDRTKVSVIQAMTEADTVVIFSHGKEDAIYLHLSSRMDIDEGVILIDKSNANILENKKVIVFACDTAKELGPYVVDKEQSVNCLAYVGFDDSIDLGLENERNNSPQTRSFFYQIYSAIFEEVLVATLNKNLSANDLAKRFRRKLSSAIHEYNVVYGIEEPQFCRNLLSDINNVLERTSKSMKIFGDTSVGLVS